MMTQPRDLRKVCSRIGFAMFAMLMAEIVLSFVFVFVAAFGMVLYQMDWIMSVEAVTVVSSVALYLAGGGLFLLILRTVPNGPVVQNKPLKMNPGKYILIFLFCLGASYLANIAMNLIFLPFQSFSTELSTEVLIEATSWGEILFNMVFIACVPALAEEYLFRYKLRQKMGGCSDVTYILFSALCFSIFHLDIRMLPYTFIVGVVFGWVYIKTGNIWYTVSFHFLYNLLGGIVIPLLPEYLGAAGDIIAYIWMGVLGILAIVLFILFFKKVKATMQPPTEVGWPYKPWQKQAAAAAQAGNFRQPAYAAPYGTGQSGYEYGIAPPQHLYNLYNLPKNTPFAYTPTQGVNTGYSYDRRYYMPPDYRYASNAYQGQAYPWYNAYGQPQYGVPAYGAPTYSAPSYSVPTHGYAPYPVGRPAAYGVIPGYTAPAPIVAKKPKSAAALCIANPGMISFLSVAGLLCLFTILSLTVLPMLVNFLDYL